MSLPHSHHSQCGNEQTESQPQRTQGPKSAAEHGAEHLTERDRGAEQSHRQFQLDAGSHPEV